MPHTPPGTAGDPAAGDRARDELRQALADGRLDAWARAWRVDDLLGESRRALAGRIDAPEWYWQSHSPMRAELRYRAHGAEALMLEVVARRDAVRASLERRRARWADQPVPPPLEGLRAHLLAALDLRHAPLREDVGYRVLTDPVRLAVEHDDRSSILDLEVLPEAATLTADPALVCGALDWLVDPATAASRQEAVEAMGVPRATRDLQALVEALREVAAPAGGAQSAWLLAEQRGRWVLVPALATPRSRGGFAVKAYRRGKHDAPAWNAADERARSRTTLMGSLDELRSHPRVFVRRDGRCDGWPRTVRRLDLQLDLSRDDGEARLALSLAGRVVAAEELASEPERVDRSWWVGVSEHHIDVVHLGRAALAVLHLQHHRGALMLPTGSALLAHLPALTEALPVRVDDGLFGAPVPADERPVVRLDLVDGELDVVVRVQPLPEAPSQPVGRGSEVVAGERGDRVVHVRRDLSAEVRAVRKRLASVTWPPQSRVDDGADAGFHWHIDDLQGALDVIEQLRAAGDRVAVRWGGTRPVLAPDPITARQVTLQVAAGKRDWFGLGGHVDLDGQRLPLGSVLEAAMEGLHWVSLSDGQWARLSEGLRTMLLSSGVWGSASARRLGAVHAATLQPLVAAGATLEAPSAWTERARRASEAATLDVPLPEGLRAALRPYQREGITWLLRLAHWAPGAVLADDMGLGKTLQTLAVLAARADRPSLVVAPTSLVHNWAREAERFTPSLDVIVHHGSRRTLDARPGAVVLTTYGVLVNDAEELAATSFGTVVFDEAQALKNPSARRTRAARTLDAAFVIALSGTPIENRTAELWSLFSVVAPGLLGPAAHFRETFVGPIEVGGDATRREALARLVGSFVLRRTKAQVAADLPPRTEMVRRVLLSSAERALYDRARLAAVARMERRSGGFQVFEELLRLRQLACHPRLADRHSDVPSSKLRAIRQLLGDVRAAGQRALVFSTFTSHLDLVQEALRADGFTVRRLDGSLSTHQRLAEVDAFQEGDGDVFLVSTKAGGVGLNLTAATVVVHIDPWWNPASEDQATDRAHRIGQTQPVTVVRMVAADTIEEKIVALHATKRGLADALLAHSGSTRQVTVDELVALLSEAANPEPGG